MNESDNLISLKEYCELKKLEYHCVLSRVRNHNIPIAKKIKRVGYYDINLLENIKIKRGKKPTKLGVKKIHIINFFLMHQHNTIPELSQKLEISESVLHKVINEWINNDKCIFVESKINNNG